MSDLLPPFPSLLSNKGIMAKSKPTRRSTTPTTRTSRSHQRVEDITLAQVLDGETCAPVGFADFAVYVSNKEYTTENLLFVVWYRSYRAKYDALPETERKRIPVPSIRLSDRATPFARPMDDWADGNGVIDAPSLPLREDALSAYATFLRKGSSRELGISDELRTFARNCLKKSTAPECFQPIYEEVYAGLESQSLPAFLSLATRNANSAKQRLCYTLGTIFITLGLFSFILLTILLPKHHWALRLARLPCPFLVSLGTAQAYSAWRGFCCQLWGRRTTQLKPWEMDRQSESLINSRKAESGGVLATYANIDDIAPFCTPSEEASCDQPSPLLLADTLRPPNASLAIPIFEEPPYKQADHGPIETDSKKLDARHNQTWRKDPEAQAFGPARVVQDERVRRLHTSIMRDVCLVFLLMACTLVPISIFLPVCGLAL